LLKAVEASKANARDACRAAQLEAQLRGENANFRSLRDEAIGQKMETERKTQLLNEENRLLKARVARLTQDKIKMEREARASMSLARSLDSHAASDVEYYKRKVADLNDTVQHKNVAIAELKHEIDGYKRQIERSMSQQSRLYRK
jgi:predicted RNase H-like nuclease (RuvC/YqgF family)